MAPFNSPELRWDFRLPRVKSINTSGHKYGGVLPGVGWVLWREQADLPEELRFNVNYLGGQMPTIGMNFSGLEPRWWRSTSTSFTLAMAATASAWLAWRPRRLTSLIRLQRWHR